MGVKLMTGATGEQNIEAADDRECLAGITGTDSYVFDTGSRLKATLVDANTVTIGTGAGSMQGSRFRCPTTTTVTIRSGTQGQYRHDIIGLHFSRESSGKESLEFQALTGEPAASEGAAEDPSYTVGDLLKGDAEAFFPLYRVKLSGINADEPESMFPVLTSLRTLGTRKQVRLGNNLLCYIEGGICVISADFLSVPSSKKSYRIGTLPDGLKPLGHISTDNTASDISAYIAPLRYRGNDSKYGQLQVEDSGEITAWVSSGSPEEKFYYGCLVLPVTSS